MPAFLIRSDARSRGGREKTKERTRDTSAQVSPHAKFDIKRGNRGKAQDHQNRKVPPEYQITHPDNICSFSSTDSNISAVDRPVLDSNLLAYVHVIGQPAAPARAVKSMLGDLPDALLH